MDHLASDAPIRKHRRRFSTEFKTMVLDACNHSGQSVASVAQQYELNANLLHKWRRSGVAIQPADFVRLPVSVVSDSTQDNATLRVDFPGGIIVHWPMNRMDESVAWLKSMMS